MEINDPLIQQNASLWQRKKLRIIILTLIGLVLLVVSIFVIISITKETYDDNPNPNPNPNPSGNENESSTFQYGLDLSELLRRNAPENISKCILLKKDSPEYAALLEGDKQALKYLLKASKILEDIQLRIDDIHNIPFRDFLDEEIKKNKEEAKLTKVLFDSQKGIDGTDSLGEKIHLVKDHNFSPPNGVYPEDLTKEKYQEILIKMINEGKIEEVKNITNQRSVVEWDQDKTYLKSTDYVIYFQKEFSEIADLFLQAAEVSTNKDFNEYLKLQAKALQIADPMLDAYADKKWAELVYTPLELTLVREGDDDIFISSIKDNPELVRLLNANEIKPLYKDSLGLRIGIVNKEGTDIYSGCFNNIQKLAESMPYYGEYEIIKNESNKINQTYVDVDVIKLAGISGAFRGFYVTEDSLPNDDKLSLTIGGGIRNVFMRQSWTIFNYNQSKQKRFEEIIAPDQFNYYSSEGKKWNDVLFEIAYGFGPFIEEDEEEEDDYAWIIGKVKENMACLIFADKLKNLTIINETLANQIKVNKLAEMFPYHLYMNNSMVVFNYFYENGVYYYTDDIKIHINIEKIYEVSYNLLKKCTEIIVNNNLTEREEFVKKYTNWTEQMENVSKRMEKHAELDLHTLYENELADYILNENTR